MIIKVANTFQSSTSDSISLSFPGSTSTFTHYPQMSQLFYNVIKSALDKLNISSTYNKDTGMGTIAGTKFMIIYSLSKVYFWWNGCSGAGTTISLTYTGLSSGCEQSLGVTIKGTQSSFVVYLGSGSSIGAETFAFALISTKKMSDNSVVKGFLSSSKSNPLLYIESGDDFITVVPVVRPSSDSVGTGEGYNGFALIPAATADMAYQLTDCYLDAPALLTDNSYYTIAGVSVVVVNNSLLVKC